MAAQSIHQNSKRKDGAFIAVNCGATAEWPRESELFGHEKGAFTGAAAQMRKWKIEMDNGGTLVLDEVGDLSHAGTGRIRAGRSFYFVRIPFAAQTSSS